MVGGPPHRDDTATTSTLPHPNSAASVIAPRSLVELHDRLSAPTSIAREALARCPGDVIVLGAGGKIGPSLATLVRRADPTRRVTAVARFSDPEAERTLRDSGVDTVRCDLSDPLAVRALPDADNVLFLAGQKFGTMTDPGATWVTNTAVPYLCAERYAGARIVAYSTGSVYGLTPAAGPHSVEADPTDPAGEYAASCVGRERIFDHVAGSHGTPVAIIRLNYACALTYGVLTDIALRVQRGEPVVLTTGYVNVIWQGDANELALAALPLASAPYPFVVNVTGPETIRVRDAAIAMGEVLGRAPRFTGTEAPESLLSDTSLMLSSLGSPAVRPPTLVRWTAEWVRDGLPLLGKPTQFETRDGKF